MREPRDSRVNRAFALHVANTNLIPSTPYGHSNLPGMVGVITGHVWPSTTTKTTTTTIIAEAGMIAQW